jgi:hypothetical protein
MSERINLTDDAIRAALTVEPSSLVADDVREQLRLRVPRTRQQRALWLALVRLPTASPAVRRAATLGIAAALLVLAIAIATLIAAALRRDPLPAPGGILLGPAAGGVVLVRPDGTTSEPFPNLTGPSVAFAWSSDGARVAMLNAPGPGASWSVLILDVATGSVLHEVGIDRLGRTALEPLGTPLQWSADGRTVLVSATLDGQGAGLLIEPASGRVTRLGERGEAVIGATWSPDRRRIAWVARPAFGGDDDARLIVAGPAGEGAAEVPIVTPDAIALEQARWSVDGRTLLVSGSTDRHGVLFRVDPETGTWTDVSDRSSRAAEAPDGRSMAVHVPTSASGAGELWIVPTDRGNARRVAADVCPRVAWAPDASELLYDAGSCTGEGRARIRAVRPDGTGDRSVWTAAPDDALGVMDLAWEGIGGQVDRP